MKKGESVSGRRDLLKVAGAGLVAAALTGASARGEDESVLDRDETPGNGPKPVYLHGCGWNPELPGVFGEVCLAFEMRAELNGTGRGTFRSDAHPEVNSEFAITSARKDGKKYTFEGEVTQSADPSLVGMAVTIVAEKTGKGKGSASITVESRDKDLVVIAIIAILIGLLIPA